MWYVQPHLLATRSNPFFGVTATSGTPIYYSPRLGKYIWKSSLDAYYYCSTGKIGPDIYIKSYPAATLAICQQTERPGCIVLAGGTGNYSYYCPSLGLYIYYYEFHDKRGATGGRYWTISSSPMHKLGIRLSRIGDAGIANKSYALTAAELDDFWCAASFKNLGEGSVPDGAVDYYYSCKYALNPLNSGWTYPEGYKSVIVDYSALGKAPVAGSRFGAYTDGTVFGWKRVNQTAGGTPLPAQFTEYNTLSNGEYALKGTIALVDWYIWFDAANWIISATVGDKSSFYWQSASLIGAYAYVQNGSLLVYPNAAIAFNAYVDNSIRGTVYAGTVHRETMPY